MPEVGFYTRNKMVEYQIGKWSYSCFILAGIRKNKEVKKKKEATKKTQASDFHLNLLVYGIF